MSSTIVDRFYEDFNALIEHLNTSAELSFRNTANECFRKTLLLAAASHFEVQIINSILEFVKESSNGNVLAREFVHRQALKKRYHTLFAWEENNANKFYDLFGEKFKTFMKTKIDNNEELKQSIEAFMELGRERNRLVHQDFGTYTLEKTPEEIFTSYQRAFLFVTNIKALLFECSNLS